MSKKLTEQEAFLEDMRMKVVEQELSARSWRAMASKMQDTILVDQLQEDYDILVAKNTERMRQQRDEMIKKMEAAATEAKEKENINAEIEAV